MMMDADVRFVKPAAELIDPKGPFADVDMIFQGTMRPFMSEEKMGATVHGFNAGLYLLKPGPATLKYTDYTLKEMHQVRHNP